MGHWNSYAYDSPSATEVSKTRFARRCIHCKQIIEKGQFYTKWRGYRDCPEHHPECSISHSKQEGK